MRVVPPPPPSFSGTLSRDAVGGGGAPYATHRGAASAPQPPQAAPCRPSARQSGAEGRKRRSPSALRETASKLSRPDGGGILTSGPESPRQVSATCQSDATLKVGCHSGMTSSTVTKISGVKVPVDSELCRLGKITCICGSLKNAHLKFKEVALCVAKKWKSDPLLIDRRPFEMNSCISQE